MIVLILAGGLGTRISEETSDKPKPMVLIDDKPILWHIMKIFSIQGFNKFIIATGYRGEIISEYVDTLFAPDWQIQTLDTGLSTQTGGRIKQAFQYAGQKNLLVTYGDGLANVSIPELMKVHARGNGVATVTAVRPPARFGHLKIENEKVHYFGEKTQLDEGWINGGFFYLNEKVMEFIENDNEPFESGALTRITSKGLLNAYQHTGYFFPMDTLREKTELSKLARLVPPLWFELP